jgi:hypothetical protein
MQYHSTMEVIVLLYDERHSSPFLKAMGEEKPSPYLCVQRFTPTNQPFTYVKFGLMTKDAKLDNFIASKEAIIIIFPYETASEITPRLTEITQRSPHIPILLVAEKKRHFDNGEVINKLEQFTTVSYRKYFFIDCKYTYMSSLPFDDISDTQIRDSQIWLLSQRSNPVCRTHYRPVVSGAWQTDPSQIFKMTHVNPVGTIKLTDNPTHLGQSGTQIHNRVMDTQIRRPVCAPIAVPVSSPMPSIPRHPLYKQNVALTPVTIPIKDLIDQFQKCTLPLDFWTHYCRLRIVIYSIQIYGVKATLNPEGWLCTTWRQYKTSVGHGHLWHYTLTSFWVHLLANMLATGKYPTFEAMYSQNPDLQNGHLHKQYYSDQFLFTANAKTNWVEPDLKRLQQAVSASSEGYHE